MQDYPEYNESKCAKNINSSSIERLELINNQLRFLNESSNATGLKTAGDIKHFLIVQNKNLGKLVKILSDILGSTLAQVPPVLLELQQTIDKSKCLVITYCFSTYLSKLPIGRLSTY